MANFSPDMDPLFTRHPFGGEVPTRRGIHEWLLRSIERGATHMLVVCDTWDYDDFPVDVMPDQNVREEAAKYQSSNELQLMEVYWLEGDLEAQLAMRRSFTYGPEQATN